MTGSDLALLAERDRITFDVDACPDPTCKQGVTLRVLDGDYAVVIDHVEDA